MKIAICDDEKKICSFMREKIEHFYFCAEEEIEIRCFGSGKELLESNLDDLDVLFLDVEMPGYNGLEVAKIIRKDGYDMIIVFVTAYDNFVFESFKVKAYRYLLKPIEEKELVETLQSIHDEFYQPENEILISFQNEKYRIRMSDIVYVEGMRGKIWIHCKSDTYRYSDTFKNMQAMLDDSFFQIHQSYIINMNRIVRYDKKEVEMEGGQKVPISRHKWKQFQEEYIRHWSKVL